MVSLRKTSFYLIVRVKHDTNGSMWPPHVFPKIFLFTEMLQIFGLNMHFLSPLPHVWPLFIHKASLWTSFCLIMADKVFICWFVPLVWCYLMCFQSEVSSEGFFITGPYLRGSQTSIHSYGALSTASTISLYRRIFNGDVNCTWIFWRVNGVYYFFLQYE